LERSDNVAAGEPRFRRGLKRGYPEIETLRWRCRPSPMKPNRRSRVWMAMVPFLPSPALEIGRPLPGLARGAVLQFVYPLKDLLAAGRGLWTNFPV
jgi:hypothetical protein